MKNIWKKAVAFAMSLALVSGNSVGNFSSTTIAKASEENSQVSETEEAMTFEISDSVQEADESYYDAETKTLHLKGYVRNGADNTGLIYPDEIGQIINIVADEGTVLPADSSYLFYDIGAETIDLRNADATNVTDMSHMFSGCLNIKSLDISNLDTSNVTNMAGMFSGWWHTADYVNISGLDTSKVTDMSHMFFFTSPESFDLTVLDTSSVTNMTAMFAWGGGHILDLSSFDTSKVTDMAEMFYMASSETIYVGPGWTTESATGALMFDECYWIVGGAGTVFDLDHVGIEYAHVDGGAEDPGYFTFKAPQKDESYFDAETGTLHLKGYVRNSRLPIGVILPDGVGTYDVIHIVADEGTVLPSDCSWLFANCGSAQTIDLRNADTSNVTDMSCMFDMFMSPCSLKSIDLSSFDTSNVTDMSDMFSGCHSLESLDLSSFDTSNVTDMSYMFCCCTSLESLDLSCFDTSNVTEMTCMFSMDNIGTSSSLKSIDLSSFDTSNVIGMGSMFSNCTSLETIIVSDKWSTESVDYDMWMFYDCVNLKGGAGTVYDDDHRGIEYAHIDGGKENPGYFTAAKTNTEDNNTVVIYIPEETMNTISTLYNNINNPTLKNIASSAMNFLGKFFSFKIV